MTKLSLKTVDGFYVICEKKDNLSLDEILPMMEQLLKASGYIFEGMLTIEDV